MILDNAFNVPKFTLNEIDSLAKDSGFENIYSMQKRAYSWIADSSPSRILSQCRRTYPKITWQDLISDNVVRVSKRAK